MLKEALPKNFLEGWAPWVKILGHKNISGFESHCRPLWPLDGILEHNFLIFTKKIW